MPDPVTTKTEISKLSVNVRAERTNEEHRTCVWVKGEHCKRERVKGER